jgi:hypothetical protein
MSQYMLLLYWDQSQEATPEQNAAVASQYEQFTQNLVSAGAMVGGDPLEPAATARSVRGGNGAATVTDGPFESTSQQLGGFYLIEADNLDSAVEQAKDCPGAQYGTVEVRAVRPM